MQKRTNKNRHIEKEMREKMRKINKVSTAAQSTKTKNGDEREGGGK